MKVFFVGNQVCTKRGLDTTLFKNYFLANGCIITDNIVESDLVVAITCAFVDSYKSIALKMIENLKKLNNNIIVYGCLPEMAKHEFKIIFNGKFFTPKNKAKIESFFPNFKIKLDYIADAFEPDIFVMKPFNLKKINYPTNDRNNINFKKSFPILRISEGCNNACSYCLHPKSLGKLKSKPLDECIFDYKRIIACGYKRISIHANDPASYGLDIGLTYLDLLISLEENTPSSDIKWNLNDIHPKYLLKYNFDLIKFIEKGRIINIGVPIQSGSQKILKKMNRIYDIKKVVDILIKYKNINPDLLLSTHIIVGFPGETEDDFNDTLSFFKKVKINNVYIFKYSNNVGTPAEKFNCQVDEQIIVKRQNLLANELSKMGCKVELFG